MEVRLPPFVLPTSPRERVAALLASVGRLRSGVALTALVVLFVAATVWLRSVPHAVPELSTPPSGESAAASGHGQGAPLPVAGAAAPIVPGARGGPLVVDVVGRVRHPGLVSVPAGSRVADAVAKAGGAASGGDLERLNLARRLVDGEQLRVPARGEPAAAGGAGADGGAQSGGPGADGPVDLNAATAAQLDALPGVGEVTAQRIIAYRQRHPFGSVQELEQVPGIGPSRFAQLKDLVTVG